MEQDGTPSFLNEEAEAPVEPVVEAQAPAEPQATGDEPTGEPAAPPAAQPVQEPHHVPLSVVLDEREKRQAAQRDAEDLRKRLAALEEQRSAPKLQDDPEAYFAHREQQQARYLQTTLWNERLNTSEALMRQQHGDDVVSAATKAFQEEVARNPSLSMELQRQANPYGFVVSWHKRQQALSEIGDDIGAYRTKLEADIRAKIMAEMQQQPPQSPVQPKPQLPPSLAAAPAAGGPITPSGGLFDQVFGQ